MACVKEYGSTMQGDGAQSTHAPARDGQWMQAISAELATPAAAHPAHISRSGLRPDQDWSGQVRSGPVMSVVWRCKTENKEGACWRVSRVLGFWAARARAPVGVGVLLREGHDPDGDLEAERLQLAHHAGRVRELGRVKVQVAVRALPPVVDLHHRPLRRARTDTGHSGTASQRAETHLLPTVIRASKIPCGPEEEKRRGKKKRREPIARTKPPLLTRARSMRASTAQHEGLTLLTRHMRAPRFSCARSAKGCMQAGLDTGRTSSQRGRQPRAGEAG